jgi:hypothetical protein
MIVYVLDVRDLIPGGRWFFFLPSRPYRVCDHTDCYPVDFVDAGVLTNELIRSLTYLENSHQQLFRVFVLRFCPSLSMLCNRFCR